MDKECWKKRIFREHGYVSKRTIHQNWRIKRKRVATVEDDNDDIDARENEEDLGAEVDDEPIYDYFIEQQDVSIKEKFGLSEYHNYEDRRQFLDREDALNIVSSVFVYNNISVPLGHDIFSVSRLLKEFPSITLTDVMKKVDKWSEHENRSYTKCSSCGHLLSQQNNCRNEECLRVGKSQTNLAGGTRILTFSLKNQLKEILESGDFGFENREFHSSSLWKKLSTTPKYLSRLRQAQENYPNVTTMFLTINMDGFRKRGLARPEVVMLSSMIHSRKTIESDDFCSAFERLRLEVEETQKCPFDVFIKGIQYKIRLEIYQTVLDMDASKKIHGVPVWQSYGSCSRCDAVGTRIKTKKGSKVAWLLEQDTKEYDNSYFPKKLKQSCLPAPWTEGYDCLHLINEGTSRDVMRNLLAGGSKYNVKIHCTVNAEWAKSLNSAKNPKGMSSTMLMDPIQLSTRTGVEVQNLFNVSVPALIVLHDEGEQWLFFLYLQWLITRLIVDPRLSASQCRIIKEVAPVVKKMMSSHYPQFGTMKQHFVLDHMVKSLEKDGSPLLSSAASFERINQVLGRGSSVYTTRTVVNMANRFIALQRAVSQCCLAIKKIDCPIQFPRSMKAVDDDDSPHSAKIDNEQFGRDERVFLEDNNLINETFL
ncbi:hypothetical protein GCK72_021437 [Caenorhabditis remanei]|uniref:Uncharacterized protein n=1 Tax=Caenorhabditis remanei TaxID=31234 RepID=A0A6A5GK44_CAERE|nr:hypothetical protein GCK72_021437 [Caenorhabditis remanei]KAF1754872.1 hypothetical protein GCK72_021437 [Caenorhabditis remanei]